MTKIIINGVKINWWRVGAKDNLFTNIRYIQIRRTIEKKIPKNLKLDFFWKDKIKPIINKKLNK